MEAVKNGDLGKASVLFDRYHSRIFNFLARLCMDRDLADDLAQNVFLRLIRYRSSYREGNRFMPWIYQMARNTFADHYRAHKNMKNNFLDVEKVANSAAETNEMMEQDEREALLHRSMARLNEEDRELLVLTRFQHLKYEEVASILDTTVANIKVKVHRAIGKLREHYFELERQS
ncbi:MAG: RNA polymerase sigma factor [Cyclobacteriaceae bacterium]|jgi:RNA polymerase sigma factor (sigma-70 family)